MLLFTKMMKNLRYYLGLVALGLATVSLSSLEAKELQGRLGLGYNGQFANASAENGVPGLSFKYGLSRDIAAALVAGISTGTPSNTVTAIKGFKNLFMETNLNFYFMGGLGFVGGDGKSGLEVLGGLGSEFFIPGIESLGFSTEVGASFTNLKGSFSFRTVGVSFLSAGIHFYF